MSFCLSSDERRMADRLIDWLHVDPGIRALGMDEREPDAATTAMLEAMVITAIQVTHECGTPEATEDAVKQMISKTIRHLQLWAG
jgi:hypothetical protein